MSNDLNGYRRAYAEISEGHDKWIETVSNRAFEYGVLAIKNLLLVSGGALIGIPAIVGLSESFDLHLAALAGMFFGAAVALSIISIYTIHINWLSHFHVALWKREKARKEVWDIFMPDAKWPGEDEQSLNRRISRDTKIIGCSFFIPHIAGLAAFGCFIYGAFRLYQSVGL